MNETINILKLRITPHGVITPALYNGNERWANGVVLRFSEDESAGLVALAASNLPPSAQVSVVFWRDIAAEFLLVLCHLSETEAFTCDAVELPSSALLAEWVLNAPPMQGAEYITTDVLRNVWQRMLSWTLAQADGCGGLGAFLSTYAPQWVRVGRVTLHLAENKDDVNYPFAFMATYSAGLSRSGRVRQLPLGQALREYAGARKKSELLNLLSPLHEAAKQSELIAEMIESSDIFHPIAWIPGEAYAFLKEIPIYEKCGLLAQLPNWWRKRARPRVAVTMDKAKNGTLGKDALLDFNMSVALGDEQLSDEEIDTLLNSQQGLVMLRGEWVEVDSQKLNEALEHWRMIEKNVGSDGMSFIKGMRLLAGASADLKDDESIQENTSWSLVEPGKHLRKILASLRTPEELSGATPSDFAGDLRPYQIAGLNWLWLCSQLGVGSCLADDMGLGKTIQILAVLLRHRKKNKKTSPSLLVIPATLIGNWKAEAAKFAPSLRIFTAHSSETSKQSLAEIALDTNKMLHATDLVITTYNMASRLDWLSSVEWEWIILDEAQAIKNPSTRQTKAVKKLNGKARVALTGTPVENRLGDLWSIFDFLNPGLLGSASRFKSFTKALEARSHARYAPLRNLVAPYILRRMKTDPVIAPDLPPKTEMQVFCGLTKPQAVLYKQSVEALKKALEQTDKDGIQRRGLVLSYLMRFKQICNHPSQLTRDAIYNPTASGKFIRLQSLCEEIASRGEKALLFTQFREITEPLSAFMAGIFGREGLILHGGIAVKKRKHLVDDFQNEDGPPFFVLSVKAGGTGLNLTAASHVIHFDRWWNPAVENQATDRAFRIGQKNRVLVHKFITRGSIEEKIDSLLKGKQEMADALLEGNTEKSLTEMSDEEILEMVSLDIERAKV